MCVPTSHSAYSRQIKHFHRTINLKTVFGLFYDIHVAQSRYYWYEIVNYAKKFILSGVLVFAEPGSTAQLYVGLIVSFYFFALLARTTPYKNPKTDRTAVIVEANLFFTLLCLLMMKINLTGEWLGQGFYDSALASSNVVAAIIPTVIAVVIGLHRLASEWVDSSDDKPRKGDLVRVLDCPSNLDSCGKIATVLTSTDGAIVVRVKLVKKQSKTMIRDCLCCKVQFEVLDHELSRAQLQLILGRKQFLKLCAGVCKQLMVCWRARGALDNSADGAGDKDPGGSKKTADQAASGMHEVDGIEDGDNGDGTDFCLKDTALDALQPTIEPHLKRKYGVEVRFHIVFRLFFDCLRLN